MKKVNIKNFFGVIFLILLGFVLLSYGNSKNHPAINSYILNSFISYQKNKVLQDPKFKNYKFDFDTPELKGNFITVSGLLNPSELDNFRGDQISNLELVGVNSTYTEKERILSPREWIEHGGFSADVPEVPASLRHFYDPTQSSGNQHLTDTVNSKIMAFFQSYFPNPNTNGIDWALGTKGNYGVLEHTYTWEHGKKYVKGALEENDPEKRKIFMARAWRSLGETLHMIADNGCPPHVRNDGHPSIPNRYFAVFGNPDPYEEILAPNSLIRFQWGKVPPKLGIKFKNASTARQIAHDLAVFTNKNFITQETISGTDRFGRTIKQITHPEYEYKSPKISKYNYEDGYYTMKIEGISEKVLMCTDIGYFSKYNIYKSYPEVTKECVYSQAKVLIPTIKLAGANVTKLFIPKLKINISEVKEDGTFTGEIIHSVDQEYKEKIYYNGPVQIRKKGTTKFISFNAKKGKFFGKINVKQKTKVYAKIEFGGITVYSDDFIIDDLRKKVNVTLKAKKTSIEPGESVSIKVEPHNSSYRFEWDFGDGSKINNGESYEYHRFNKTGGYTVTVNVYNGTKLIGSNNINIQVVNDTSKSISQILGTWDFRGGDEEGETYYNVDISANSIAVNYDDYILTFHGAISFYKRHGSMKANEYRLNYTSLTATFPDDSDLNEDADAVGYISLIYVDNSSRLNVMKSSSNMAGNQFASSTITLFKPR
jgi:PKD repeat protein